MRGDVLPLSPETESVPVSPELLELLDVSEIEFPLGFGEVVVRCFQNKMSEIHYIITVSCNRQMESVIDFLCPEVRSADLEEKIRLVTKYLHERLMTPDVVSEKKSAVECELCGNDDENLMIRNYNEGSLICLGRDGGGCGCVVMERMYEYPNKENLSPDGGMYSEQYRFRSFWNNRSHQLRYLNGEVEKKLTRCGLDNAVTSDLYKDDQRDYVYSLLDNMKIVTLIDHDWIDAVKIAFHNYRTSMMRIHKLHVTLAALFAFVKETSCRNL